jgi:aspartate oxidase
MLPMPPGLLQDTLTRKVRNNPNITILEDHIAIDLITGESSASLTSAATAPTFSTIAQAR